MNSNTQPEKVSVIIPVYNTKKEYLKECLDSVMNQSYKNLEILIIDDGSEKETAVLCDTFANEDSRVIVIHKLNEGVSVARNVGIEKATGEWITFVDSDDILVNDGIERLIKNEDCDIIVSIASIYSDNIDTKLTCLDMKTTQKKLISEIMVDKNKESSVASPCNKLYKRKFLNDNNIRFPVGIALGEDGIFNIIGYSKADNIMLSKEKVYIYRINENSVTQKYSEDTINEVNKLLNFYRNDIWQYIAKENLRDYYYFVIRQLNYVCIKQIFNKKSNLNRTEKMQILKNILSQSIYQEAIKKVRIRDVSVRRKFLIILIRRKLYNFIPIIYNKKTIK